MSIRSAIVWHHETQEKQTATWLKKRTPSEETSFLEGKKNHKRNQEGADHVSSSSRRSRGVTLQAGGTLLDLLLKGKKRRSRSPSPTLKRHIVGVQVTPSELQFEQ